ncbi:MAG: Ig-like domain-containing protein [Clostridiales Family XIII bacterium]|jgi:hypothetical protein|nr:Ig-like domain-containing protein [Clostridiales Family XIII bacterium]
MDGYGDVTTGFATSRYAASMTWPVGKIGDVTNIYVKDENGKDVTDEYNIGYADARIIMARKPVMIDIKLGGAVKADGKVIAGTNPEHIEYNISYDGLLGGDYFTDNPDATTLVALSDYSADAKAGDEFPSSLVLSGINGSSSSYSVKFDKTTFVPECLDAMMALRNSSGNTICNYTFLVNFPTLKVYVDKDALRYALIWAKHVNEWADTNAGDDAGKITASSRDALSTAIADGQSVMDKPDRDCTQAEIDKAVEVLEAAVRGMGITPPKNPENNNPAGNTDGNNSGNNSSNNSGNNSGNNSSNNSGNNSNNNSVNDSGSNPINIMTNPSLSPAVNSMATVTNTRIRAKIRTPLKTIYLTKGGSYNVPFVIDVPGKKFADSAGMTVKASKVKTTNAKASGKKAVVKVTKRGRAHYRIKALRTGKATVTFRLNDGAVMKVRVIVQKKNVSLKKYRVQLPKKLKKGKLYQIRISGMTKKASNIRTVTFKSSKKSIVTVDRAGKVTPLKKGKAKITVKVGKIKKIIKVTVR